MIEIGRSCSTDISFTFGDESFFRDAGSIKE